MRCFDPARACPLCKRWDSSEIDRLRDMAGRKTIPEIVAALNQEFERMRPPLSYNAVVIAARRRGIDLVLTRAVHTSVGAHPSRRPPHDPKLDRRRPACGPPVPSAHAGFSMGDRTGGPAAIYRRAHLRV